MKKNIFLADILFPLCLLIGLWLAVRPNLVVAQETTGHPVYMPIIVGSTPGFQSTDIVRMPKDAYLQVAERIRIKRLIDYDNFVWLEIDTASLDVLDEAGVPYELQQDAFVLLLNRFQFDPLEGEPEIPPTQRTSYAPGEKGFYLVQFFGPAQDAWLARLLETGVQVIQFQPSFAYIVRMTPEEAELVTSLEFVRWVGVYHAAYRIAPSLLVPPSPVPEALEQIIENVDVTIFNDGQTEQTLVAIRELGGQIIQNYPATPDGSLVTAILTLPFENVVSVAQLSSVLWMNRSSPRPGFDDEVSDQIVVGNHAGGVPFTGYNTWLTSNGLDGTGVTVALVDTGMDTNNNATAHLDIRGRIAAFVAYAGAPATDTNGHGTHVGGVIAGNASIGTTDPNGFLYGEGIAPNAQLVVQNATSGAAWPPAGGWQQLSQDSVNNGAVASNNSWFTGAGGAQGYSAPARTHDIMVRDADFTTAGAAEPLIMVFSAGNSGPGASTITEPKEAKNLITVGAAENLRSDPWVVAIGCGTPNNINNITSFSSRGPSLDGRILPNVTAPGTFIASLRSATGAFGGGVCSGIIDANYVWFSGTSQAAPHVTGGVTLITEWWRDFNAGANPSPAMAKALLINGAVDMDSADIPNNNEGWGRVNFTNVVDPGVPVIYQDQTTTLGASGQTWELAVGPSNPALPLKVTLVWSDAPGAGSGGGTASWVNDLDLSLSQGATLFRGNVFTNGWSTTGGAADSSNNVENVYIQNPSGGYNITVNATNIAGDGVPISGDMTDQDFALVCYNCIPAADVSVSKSDSPDPVAAGGMLNYTVDVTNDGPADAENVVLTDILPAGVSFVSSVPGSPTCNEAAGTVTCNLGNISSGDMIQVTITVLVDADLVYNNGGPVVINNQASVTSTTPDADLDNNETTEDTLVVAVADLEIASFEALDPPAEILIGEDVEIAFEKVITNNGPSAPMDTELTLTAAASPGASVNPALLVFPELALDLNEMRLVEEVFTVSCDEPGAHTFSFNNEIQPLNAADTDPDQSNNTAEVNLEIECVVPVKINIKPGSFPNSINLKNMGVIPVGILTTEAGEYDLPLAFDATSIDPLSVRFGPEDAVWDETGGAFEAHDRGHIEDTFELDEVTKDGDDDMVLHFRTQETGIASDDTEACVKGEFVAEDDSIFKFFGCDSIRIVPPQ